MHSYKELMHTRERTMTHKNGYYEKFGGKYVPEILMEPLEQLETEFDKAIMDDSFVAEFETLLS